MARRSDSQTFTQADQLLLAKINGVAPAIYRRVLDGEMSLRSACELLGLPVPIHIEASNHKPQPRLPKFEKPEPEIQWQLVEIAKTAYLVADSETRERMKQLWEDTLI